MFGADTDDVRRIVREENDKVIDKIIELLNLQLNIQGHEGRIVIRTPEEEEAIRKRH